MIILYKRRHSAECLAELDRRNAKGKLFNAASRGTFLAQYKNCSCVWWARGTDQFGVSIPKHSTGATTLEAALVVQQSLYTGEEVKPAPPAPPPVRALTLSAAREQWEKEKLSQRADSTRTNYLRALDDLAAFLGDRSSAQDTKHRSKAISPEKSPKMDDVTIDVLYQLQSHWRDRGVMVSTANLYRTHLNVFFRWMLKRKIYDRNPVADWEPLEKPRLAFDEEEETTTLPLDVEGDSNWQRIREGLPEYIENRRQRSGLNHWLWAQPENFVTLLEVMYHTGLRISDATMFAVHKIQDSRFGGVYTTRQIKTGTPVTVYLPFWLVQKLRSLPKIDGPWVFFDGSKDLRTYIDREIRLPLRAFGEKILSLTGILRPHRFRDSFAINEINEGCDIKDLSIKLGHKSVQMTEAHYLPFVKSRREAIEARHYAKKAVHQLAPAGAAVVDISAVRKAG